MRHAGNTWLVCAALMLALAGGGGTYVVDDLDRRIDGPLTKGGRGLGNILTCWMEVPSRIRKTVNRRDPLSTLATGIGKGLGWGVARFGVGVYEVVTFPVPFPKRYRPILPPLDYWKSDRFDTLEQTYENTLR